MSVALAPVTISDNAQAIMLKSMVPDLEQFDEDQTKFED